MIEATSRTLRSTLLSAALTLVAACGGNAGDEFKSGIPSTDNVALEAPGETGASSQGLTGTVSQGLGQGQKADWYVITRAATAGVNGGTVAVLKLVEAITDHPPTSVSGNVAVWGPHTESLSPNTWKLTVTKVSETHFDYVLEGRGKEEPDSAFKVILSGSHTPAVDASGARLEGFGNGTFLIDWDAASSLPENDGNVGTAAFTYSRLSATSDVTIEVAFRQVHDKESSQRVDADYGYVKTPGQGGSFTFELMKNMDGNPAIESLGIHSRWLSTGAGRADVKVSGGDVGTLSLEGSECWDSSFNSRYLNASWAAAIEYGDPATDCAFPTAEFVEP